MSKPNHQEKRQQDIPARPQMAEVFGFQVPTSNYYLYQGHTWAMVEKEDRVRVGVDDFSQKLLGPADKIKLPTIGKVYYQDHICMALFRQGHKAPFLAPVDGVIEEIITRRTVAQRVPIKSRQGASTIFRKGGTRKTTSVRETTGDIGRHALLPLRADFKHNRRRRFFHGLASRSLVTHPLDGIPSP